MRGNCRDKGQHSDPPSSALLDSVVTEDGCAGSNTSAPFHLVPSVLMCAPQLGWPEGYCLVVSGTMQLGV